VTELVRDAEEKSKKHEWTRIVRKYRQEGGKGYLCHLRVRVLLVQTLVEDPVAVTGRGRGVPVLLGCGVYNVRGCNLLRGEGQMEGCGTAGRAWSGSMRSRSVEAATTAPSKTPIRAWIHSPRS
jgi:hypothetical protein